jgi:hypothetical protein
MQDAVLAALTRLPGGGWHLDPARATRLSEQLERMARQAPDVAAATRPVLKLIAALEAESGPAAEALVAVLRATPSVYRALRQAKLHRATGGRRAKDRLSTFEGRRASATAPIYDAPAPQGTLPARELIRPLERGAARTQKR